MTVSVSYPRESATDRGGERIEDYEESGATQGSVTEFNSSEARSMGTCMDGERYSLHLCIYLRYIHRYVEVLW